METANPWHHLPKSCVRTHKPVVAVDGSGHSSVATIIRIATAIVAIGLLPGIAVVVPASIVGETAA